MAASGTGKCLGLTVSVNDVGMSFKLCGFSQLSYYFFRLQVCTDKICEKVCYTTLHLHTTQSLNPELY